MVADSELQLRDFDGETEDSDSETELLIRHSARGGARQPAKRGSIATSRYYLHDYSTATQPTTAAASSLSATNIATGFLSNLFGNTTNSLGRAAGQVRLRNERSRERDKYAASRARTQQLQEQQQQYQRQQARTTALSFGGFNTGLGTSAKLAKLAQTTQTSYRVGGGDGASGGVDAAAHGVTESVALGVRSSSGQSGAHKRYDATGATSATSESASGGSGMGGGAGVVLQQTVLDAENGSTTVYYQKNRRRSKRRSLANLCKMCLCGCWRKWFSPRELRARTVHLGRATTEKFPPNEIRNQKYNVITFLPLVLFEQFRFFLNLYFLLMALSQFIPDIRIGYPYTYWGPLSFVLMVTIGREAVDDLRRHQRDHEVNSQKYKRLTVNETPGYEMVPSSKLKVGDMIIVEKNERVPADLVLLRTSDKSGSVFVRTDQLDGETDWKLRLAVPLTQKLNKDSDLFNIDASVYIEKPQNDIHSFIGTFSMHDGGDETGLNVENTLWANTVVAAGTATGIVIYTGCETRSVMNNSQPRSKVGLLDVEINGLTKVLFCAVLGLSLVMMMLKGFSGPWYRYMFRFVLLFSYIIPISLRVNLDMGKAFYSWQMQNDPEIQGTVVRSTTIPEELGRISYVLTDKTGTLTQNEMVFKKIHLGIVSHDNDTFHHIGQIIQNLAPTILSQSAPGVGGGGGGSGGAGNSVIVEQQQAPLIITNKPMYSGNRMRHPEGWREWEAVKALALCHNVTPITDEDDNKSVSTSSTYTSSAGGSTSPTKSVINVESSATEHQYQASSPDEIALVKWTAEVGLTLIARDINSMTLQMKTRKSKGESADGMLQFQILQLFPFTSESKRMGIIVRDSGSGEITFYLKGADVVMTSIVQYNDWLSEESGNMAREGLRTLVVAKKVLSEEQYNDFETRISAARLSVTDRVAKVAAVIESLEREMELLCLTGVEDRLQDGVRPTLELLRNAGVRVWMLTGDKLETACCIAKSSQLIGRNQGLHVLRSVSTRTEAHAELNNFRRKQGHALVISGESLEVCLQYYRPEFLELATASPAVVCCRCSPTQKAQVVQLIQHHTGKRTCAVGDGGNDVSMIQQADAGVGIEGREGRQASLAGDFSVPQFSHIAKLLLVHGRRSYKRSAALSQFVIHRGLIITTLQAVFSAVFYLSSVALYQGFLMVGYSTLYTMFPVFSLVLDQDITSTTAVTYPELYKDLSKGRSLSYKTFFIWVLISIYQGGVIMYGALILFEDEFIHIVAISFSALIVTELIMVALTVRTWHRLMVLAELFSLALYLISLAVLHEYFDWEFIWSYDFLWKVSIITLVSCFPLYIIKFLRKKCSPPSYLKLS